MSPVLNKYALMSRVPFDAANSVFLRPLLPGTNLSPAILLTCLLLASLTAIGVLFSRIISRILSSDIMQGLGLFAFEQSRKVKLAKAFVEKENRVALNLDELENDVPSEYTYPGLLNTSTTCYLNSAVQSLASSPSFNKYLSTLLASTDLDLEVTSSLSALLRALNTPSKQFSILRTTNVVNSLMSSNSKSVESKNRKRIMQGSGQQDAQEFFLILSEAVEEEKKLVSDESLLQRHEKGGFRELLMPLEQLKLMSAFVSCDTTIIMVWKF